MRIDNKFNIEQTVYLKTDPEQHPRIVFGITVFKTDILYELCCGEKTSKHYDFEITEQRNVL